MSKKIIHSLLVASMLLILSCHVTEERTIDSSPYSYEKPSSLNDGIAVNTADARNINTNLLTEMVNAVRRENFPGVDSLLISINNELVLEEYFAGWSRDDIHDLRSATKSITGLLTGIAIDQQLLQLDMAVYPHFAAYYPATDNWTPDKNLMQLKHFLNMSSGHDCNDDDDNSAGNESKMYRFQDWVKFILDLPMARRPGVWFSYCTGGVQLVARMIENQSHTPLSTFARTNLFEPMAIQKYQWSFTGSGRTEGSGHIYMRPRDMLKLGLLVLNNGEWQGQQLVSSDWIEQMRNPYFSFYGNFWWHDSFDAEDQSFPKSDAIYASGNGGQQIWIFPSIQLVIVFTANNYDRRVVSRDIIRNYILPAVYQQ